MQLLKGLVNFAANIATWAIYSGNADQKTRVYWLYYSDGVAEQFLP